MITATATVTTTFTHVTTYFADKMLMLVGNIIRDSGLSMSHFASSRSTLEQGLKTWLQSGHLLKVTLEIFKPSTTTLIRRWDLDWNKCDAAESGFWVDIADIKYHMAKAGVVPSSCGYKFIPRLNFVVQHLLGLKEALIGCFVAMSFSWSVVEVFGD